MRRAGIRALGAVIASCLIAAALVVGGARTAQAAAGLCFPGDVHAIDESSGESITPSEQNPAALVPNEKISLDIAFVNAAFCPAFVDSYVDDDLDLTNPPTGDGGLRYEFVVPTDLAAGLHVLYVTTPFETFQPGDVRMALLNLYFTTPDPPPAPAESAPPTTSPAPAAAPAAPPPVTPVTPVATAPADADVPVATPVAGAPVAGAQDAAPLPAIPLTDPTAAAAHPSGTGLPMLVWIVLGSIAGAVLATCLVVWGARRRSFRRRLEKMSTRG